MARSWLPVLSLWLIGVLAAAQLAKFAVMAPLLRARFGLSLAQAGLLVSLLEVGGALFGFAAGLAIGRLGARRLLSAGLALLAAAGAAEGLSSGAAALFTARAVEGIGYLLVVIAAPTMIISVTTTASRAAALALWSTFVPVGMACGSALTGQLVDAVGFGGTNMVWSAACLAALMASLRMRPSPVAPRAGIALPQVGAWLATLAFGCYTVFVSALTALLPTFLVERTGASIGGASVATSLASIAALPGAAIAILILRGARSGYRRLAAAMIAMLLATMMLAPGTFVVAATAPLRQTTAFAVLVVALSAVAASIVFTRLPALAGARSAEDSRIAAANGLVTQFGAAGALVGPPLGARVVETWGWHALGLAITILAGAMLALVLLAEGISQPLRQRRVRDDIEPSTGEART
ncbi:MFS transporter [Sphingomonas sp. ASY06-1R]|uniref:MFS transporter n=1 Tax=Sphingomonas sp. ASY06-1R TaxID=3445771 RepID=UPI003FA1CD78